MDKVFQSPILDLRYDFSGNLDSEDVKDLKADSAGGIS